MRRIGIAAMQCWVGGEGNNVEHLTKRLNSLMATYPWLSMVVLSELAPHGPSPVFAETLPGPTEQAFQDLAKRHGIYLLTGSMYELVDDKVLNTCSVIDPTGEVIARYRKMFPFRPFAAEVAAGEDFCVFDVPGVGRFGVLICYDMWFPETARTLAAMGAEVILHPVMTGTIDRDVELSIARATAATNQCYVIDVNGVGIGGLGRSIMVGPDGDVIHQAGPTEEMIPFEIDLDRVTASRERGIHGLGQPLKSFREAPIRFDVYDPDSPRRAYLSTLGPLVKPQRAYDHTKKKDPNE